MKSSSLSCSLRKVLSQSLKRLTVSVRDLVDWMAVITTVNNEAVMLKGSAIMNKGPYQKMAGREEIESILQYKDRALLDEALLASGAGPSQSRNDARRHGNKGLALIEDALLRLVIVDDGITEGASTGKFHC